MPTATPAMRRRSMLPSRAIQAMAQPRFAELCRRYPGPAAFVDADGHVLDMNDAAPPMLDAVDARPGGLKGLVTAIGGFSRFDSLDVGTPTPRRLDIAFVPMAEGVLLLGRDRSLTDNLNEALAESRSRYKDLVDVSSDFAWEVDAAGVFTFVSARGAIGFESRELIGSPAREMLRPAGEEFGAAEASPFLAVERIDDVQFWTSRRDGEPALLSVSAMPLFAPTGAWRGARGVARDVTAANERETELAESETRDRILAHVLRALVDAEDADGGIAAALRSCVRAYGAAGGQVWRREPEGFVLAAMLGPQPGEAPDLEALEVGSPPDAPMGEGRLLLRATAFRHRINGAIMLWRGDAEPAWPVGDVALFDRIATQFGLALAQISLQEELERQARTDPLTGLLNRRAFLADMAIRLSAARRSARPAALVYVDVDNFKAVNDLHGHAAGDGVLRRIADRLRRGARASDLVARVGGDEFALWLDEADPEGAERRGRELLAIRDEIADMSGSPEQPLGISVGIVAVDPRAEDGIDRLIERADAAMYEAKRGGKGRLVTAPAGAAR